MLKKSIVAALTGFAMLVALTARAEDRSVDPVSQQEHVSQRGSCADTVTGRAVTEAEARQTLEALAEVDAAAPPDNRNRLEELGLVDGMIPTATAIASFDQRVRQNPQDIVALTMLGRLYLRHAKESDDLSAYQQAEDVLRRAVEINTSYLPAKTHLATALAARHQFAEALDLASEAFVMNPANTLALATIGDCRLQLGQYEDAGIVYDALAKHALSAEVLARLAHLEELHGRPAKAIEFIQQAAQHAEQSAVTAESMAWYRLRLADLYFDRGDFDTAAENFEAALHLVPHYAPAMAGLAAVQAAKSDLPTAETTLRSAVERHGEPPLMAALGDVLAKRGKPSEAAEWYRRADEAMAEEALTAAAAHYREVAVFYADHDMQPERALKLARQDLRMRQDIHAHDTLAWTLYRNGRFDEALEASRMARRLGTKDASLHFHAGMIHAALNNRNEAIKALQTALEINPGFSLLLSDIARGTLADLQLNRRF